MTLLRRLLREPLLHFLLLGAGLFALEAAARPQAVDDSHTIVISPDFVRALNRRAEAPAEADEDGLIRTYVRDEALYREAKRIGLDEGDVIVRRRLVQKMEFLLRGLADVAEPSDGDLEAFVAAHTDLFEAPPRVWFEEVYFARGSHIDGAQGAHTRAERVLGELSAAGNDADAGVPEARGDPRPGGYGGQGVTHAQLAARRSLAFADAVFEVAEGRWSQPIDADMGSHLVRVTRRTSASVPALDAIRARARQAFINDAREQAYTEAADTVIARYRVERTASEPSP